MVDDSPCTGDCRMIGEGSKAKCRSCNRTYDDLEQWLYLTREARLERMEQLKNGNSRRNINGITKHTRAKR